MIDEKAIVGVMSAISAVNGIPSAANKYLLTDVQGEFYVSLR